MRLLLLAAVCVTPMAMSPATPSASSVTTLVRVGEKGLLHHVLGCRHWLVIDALRGLMLFTSALLVFLVGVKSVFFGSWFYPQPDEMLFVFLHQGPVKQIIS